MLLRIQPAWARRIFWGMEERRHDTPASIAIRKAAGEVLQASSPISRGLYGVN